jgi:hypothetical protein
MTFTEHLDEQRWRLIRVARGLKLSKAILARLISSGTVKLFFLDRDIPMMPFGCVQSVA